MDNVEDIKKRVDTYYEENDCDGIAVAIIDFKNHKFESFEQNIFSNKAEKKEVHYDLASLTKPLVNSFSYLSEKLDDPELYALLNHRAGIIPWGLLPKSSWQNQIESYEIKENSKTLYSDFSALRYLLEFERKTGRDLQQITKKNLNEDVIFWKDLTSKNFCVKNGYFDGKENIGKVHDPNAYNLNCFTNHAGLFGTISSVAKSLLEFNKKENLLETVKNKIISEEYKYRFVYGFDRVIDLENTLAGSGCGKNTFGHLGFTGTSFWIDPDKGIGHVILTNATKEYWFNKANLNLFRREFGKCLWK